MPHSRRLLAALLAAVGALTIIDWTLFAQLSTWYFANLPGVAMNRGVVADTEPLLPIWMYSGVLFILRLLGSLLAFYLIIRAGLVDAGPVYRRIVASIILALLIVAALSLANVALMPYFANYALIVPLEIFAAIAVGYWVSGLRDLAGCLSLGCIDAWSAWANGRLQEERDVLVQSLGLAERTRHRGIIAEVHAQIVFSSWRNGEDGAFEQKVDALQRVLCGRNCGGSAVSRIRRRLTITTFASTKTICRSGRRAPHSSSRSNRRRGSRAAARYGGSRQRRSRRSTFVAGARCDRRCRNVRRPAQRFARASPRYCARRRMGHAE